MDLRGRLWYNFFIFITDYYFYFSVENKINKKGPLKWANTWSNARGKHQSPINIETHKAIFDPDLSRNALRIEYDSLNACRRISNTGHTFQVDAHSHNDTSKLIFI